MKLQMGAGRTYGKPLTGVILAGGENKRMGGRLKALLEWGGRTFLELQLEQMNQICEETFIVTNRPELLTKYRSDKVRFTADVQPGLGPLAGMQAALRQIGDGAAVWLVGCDMPFVSAGAAAVMAALYEEYGVDAVIPCIDGRLQPLHAIYGRQCLAAVERHLEDGERRMMKLLDSIRWIAADEASFKKSGISLDFVQNVNTTQQYKLLTGGPAETRFQRETIKVEEAQRRIFQHLRLQPPERVPLEMSFGRRLAKPVAAAQPVPHFRRSGVDGYALAAADTADTSSGQPAALDIVESILCGDVPALRLKPGQAARIMTGAMVPEGADAVVMLEMTDKMNGGGPGERVCVKKRMTPGENVTPIGHEAARGEPVLERGRLIRAGEMAVLAAFGHAEAEVYKPPRVAIFATGSELLDLNVPLAPGKIRNSNSYMLAALVCEAGGDPIVMPVLPDDAAEVGRSIEAAALRSDMIITTGGVSVGDKDVLTEYFADRPGALLFNKVAMRPGSPTTAGIVSGKLLFALSGNPGACYVGFQLFVKPFMRGMLGAANVNHPECEGLLEGPYAKGSAYPRYVRGMMEMQGERLIVKPAGLDKSSSMMSIKDADCLIFIPAGGSGAAAGQKVRVIRLDSPSG
ncbi:gephyrin-like molybdotransferase Glp [Paenibacillus thalictri]|uniref:Probable molybdenum cofactor guanylyltransferase n=1 Tax=Paenibacillus thalictri TaxID=2527873 RepID=A0A4Q9DEH1_9BACL|nr:gephyrin-like molybdotransferase Glp [Paenibacillus thalictri]TBL67911.1 hypothetical protein EYB31_39165 [Paenibacillus thalictri]